MQYYPQNQSISICGSSFYPIKEEHKALFMKYMLKEETPYIHQSFGYNFSISGTRINILWSIIEGCLCIFKLYRSRLTLAALPLGVKKNNIGEVLKSCNLVIKEFNKNNKGRANICDNLGIPEGACLEESGFILKPSLLGNEYSYDCQNLMEMRGNRLEVFRRNVKKFTSLFETKTNVNDTNGTQKLLDLYNEWQNEWMNRKGSIALIYDKDYYKRSIENARIIDHKIITVYEGDRLIGMTGIIPFNKDTCLCLARKSSSAYRGISEYLVHKACEVAIQNGYKFMNDSWDANHDGLKQFKRKCCPVKINKLYYLIHEERNGNNEL